MSAAHSDAMYDLLIVGAGSVGLTMGATWGRLGRTAMILDKQPRQYGLPRAGHIDHEIMRMLQQLEAEQPVVEDAFETENYTWVNGEGETLLEFPWGEEGISGWHSDFMQNSAILERSLLDRVLATPGLEHRPGWQAVALVQHDDHVELTIEKTEVIPGEPVPVLTGARHRIRGRYLVAGDGANSQIRRWLGIGRSDLGFNERWLVVDARIKRPLSLAFDCGQICDPRRPTTILPLGRHHRRWEWHLRPDEDPQDFLRPEAAWRLLADLGVTPDDVEPVRHLVYTFEARMAHRWRSGRVLLAGDAAHTMPPFMGQGMCSGMRDARNLAWKLDLVLSGAAAEDLLDTYQTEREPHVRDWTAISLESGKVSCTIDADEARRRDEMFRAGYRPPMPDFPRLEHGMLHHGADGRPAGAAGELGLQGRIQVGDRVDLFDRLLPSTGFTVISTADPRSVLSPDRITALERLNCSFVHLSPVGTDPATADAIDVDGTYGSYLRARDADVVINRPDFYVFGACPLADLPRLVDDLLGRLPAAPSPGERPGRSRTDAVPAASGRGE